MPTVSKLKASVARQMTEPEAQQKLRELREELFNLRFRHATNPVENPLRIRVARREIALVETTLNENAATAAVSVSGEEGENG